MAIYCPPEKSNILNRTLSMFDQDRQVVLDLIAQTLYDKKGFNLLAIDISKISVLTHFILIAEGNVDRHVIALSEAVIKALDTIGERPIHVEGMRLGDWVAIDCLDIMVHIFMLGMRDKYRLEELWNKGEIVDLHLKLPATEKIR